MDRFSAAFDELRASLLEYVMMMSVVFLLIICLSPLGALGY
jgi:hypothetical protein